MDIGTAKPSAAARAEVPHHLLDLVDPGEEFTVTPVPGRGRARPSADIAARGRRALLVGGTGLYLRSVVDDLDIPGRWPEVAAELAAEADRPGGLDALYAPAGRPRPAGRRAHDADQPPPGAAGPRGDARLGPAVLLLRSGARPPTRRPPVVQVGLATDPAEVDSPDRRAVRPLAGRGTARRGAGPGRAAGRAVAHGPPGPRLPRAPGPRGGAVPPGAVRRRGRAAHPRLRPPPAVVVPPRPADRLARARRRPAVRPLCRARCGAARPGGPQ